MTERAKDNSKAGELNLGIVLRAQACYVEDHFGRAKRDELLEAVGLNPAEFDGRVYWGTLQHAEDFFARVFDLIGRDEKKFVDISGYKLEDSFGPVKYLVRAKTPSFVYENMAKTFHKVVSPTCDCDLLERSAQSCVIRYKSPRSESRLLCLSRHGSMAAIPSIWGLPKAAVSETKCLSWGDDCCEYQMSWFRAERRLLPLIGFVLGACTVLLGSLFDPALMPSLIAPAILLPVLGFLLESRKNNRSNLRFSERLMDEMRTLIEDDIKVRREILELNERQRDWEKSVNREAAAERQLLVEQLSGLQSRLSTHIRGYGHDINSPLSVLMAHSSILQKAGETITKTELAEILKYNEEAIVKINRLVREMMAAAKAHKSLKNVVAQEIDVPELGRQLESRARALVHGRPIETAVQLQEPVPAVITTDRLMVDRILDNLMMNAAKYTREGRIDIHLSDLNGDLALEVRDTGRGIAREDMPGIFEPEGSDEATRAAGSFGLGLSVVTELLAQLGGRLFVESEPGKGSSFKCVLPAEYQPPFNDEEPPAAVVSY